MNFEIDREKLLKFTEKVYEAGYSGYLANKTSVVPAMVDDFLKSCNSKIEDLPLKDEYWCQSEFNSELCNKNNNSLVYPNLNSAHSYSYNIGDFTF